ncbi:MAG: hypothetical protein AABO57_19995 [Acidobacteriota bacterium]
MYSPIGGVATFQLPLYEFSQDEVLIFGEASKDIASTFLRGSQSVLFPLHPDMQRKLVAELNLYEFEPTRVLDTVAVVPTANGRTVYCLGHQPPLYLKLHYDGILGRVDRKLPIMKTVAGTEISEELVICFSRDSAPSGFAFLPEPFALVKTCAARQGTEEVGCIFRTTKPLPFLGESFLIPFFSLFSQDTLSERDPLLLVQLLGDYRHPWETLRRGLIEPLLRGYCFLVFDLGLIPEFNAQNLLLAIDDQYQFKGVVMRDLQGLEKDLTIRGALGLQCQFKSEPYKCIDRASNERDYFIRHSFSYDFKLGEYIFEELVAVIARTFRLRATTLREEIKYFFREFSLGRDSGHFYPRDSWFIHDRILLTRERPYVELENPKFRFS